MKEKPKDWTPADLEKARRLREEMKLSWDDIALVMKCSRQTVQNRLDPDYRTRRRLQMKIAEARRNGKLAIVPELTYQLKVETGQDESDDPPLILRSYKDHRGISLPLIPCMEKKDDDERQNEERGELALACGED